jgi:hypothetical protein
MSTTIAKETVFLEIIARRYINVNEPDFRQDYSFYNSRITEYTGPGRLVLAPRTIEEEGDEEVDDFVSLDFQGVTKAKVLVLQSSNEFEVKFNGGDTVQTGKSFMIESETGISAVKLRNPDTSNRISVSYFLADDSEQ